ncbi:MULTISPECIES: DUF4190 domain-containing protein [unclassified Streptomyces]|uniref:DUF4190 domain-containing protein n=1 Tax=unclassified Streptomyces TaxID=2593676 RepID=UPI0036FEE3A0
MEPTPQPQPSEPGTPPVPGAPVTPAGPAPAAYPTSGPYAAPGPYTSPGMPYTGVPGPYGPYGRPVTTTNGLAIGSLVSGIVCCLPPLGLVLGIFSLRQIKRRGQGGKGLAIAGTVLSSISTLLVLLGLVTGQVQDAVRGFRDGMREAASSRMPMELRTGECFLDDVEQGEYTLGVRVVDCAEPHDGEITGRFEVTGFDGWPGDRKLEELGEERCDAMAGTYVRDTWALTADSLSLYYYPDRQAWRQGERRIACGIGGEERTTGSLRSDATTLDPAQLAFLTHVNPIEDAAYGEPEDDPEDDLEANRAWAADVRAAVDSARSGLRGRTWEQSARAPVDAYLKGLDSASKQWAKLARAEDADAFWEAYDRAFELLSGEAEADAREALGLTSTPPEAPEDHGSV